MNNFMKYGLFFIIISVVVAGCSGASTEEKAYESLEESVKIERAFASEQQSLIDLEQKEQDIYEQMIELAKDEDEQWNEYIDEAMGVQEERTHIIELEKEMMEDSKEAFDESHEWIEKIDDDETKKIGLELTEVMDERFATYDELYELYVETLANEQALYELYKSETIDEEAIKQKVDDINTSYEELMSVNERFNHETEAYNSMKKTFYEALDLDITFEED